MKRILFIKLTSLGDLIHAFPALTDASRAYPDLKIDWMIDENFAEVAKWHPGIDQVFMTNHRRWLKGLASSINPIVTLVKKIRQVKYDLIIDGQGNFKTALFALSLSGPIAGFDFHSIREPIASFAYKKKFRISLKAHAIDRLRQLFALSLNYPLPIKPPEFPIDKRRLISPSFSLPSHYLVFIHNAGWKTKLWPEAHGMELIRLATQKGISVLLPWGNTEERARAYRLSINNQAIVLPKLTLSEMGFVIAGARACICMDTGLSHLSAALNVPSITLYGATDSGLIGTCGKNQLNLQSTFPCAPCHRKQCRFPSLALNPPCLAQLTPQMVSEQLFRLMNDSQKRTF